MKASSASTNPENHSRTRWLYGPLVAFVVLAFIASLALPQSWMTR